MPGAWMLFPPLLTLALGPVSGGVDIPNTLPTGDDPAFRARMMEWSRPAPESESPPHIVLRAEMTTTLPRLSSRFGYRVDPMHGGQAMHEGIDIPGPMGTPVRAAEAGVVRFASAAGGYGNLVEIAHAGDVVTRYGHLSRLLVREGTRVARGDVIALMGSTGRSTGSHLHFEIRLRGRAIDPISEIGGAPEGAATPPEPLSAGPPHLSAFARTHRTE